MCLPLFSGFQLGCTPPPFSVLELFSLHLLFILGLQGNTSFKACCIGNEPFCLDSHNVNIPSTALYASCDSFIFFFLFYKYFIFILSM